MIRHSDYLWVLVGTAALAAMLYGCAATPAQIRNDPLPEQGEALARAEVRREAAVGHVVAARPSANEASKVHLDSAQNNLAQQRQDLDEARRLLTVERSLRTQMQADSEKVHAELSTVKAGWGWRAQDFCHRWWTRIKWAVFCGLIVLAILRAIAANVTSTVLQWVLSSAARVLQWIVTGGCGLVSDITDWLTHDIWARLWAWWQKRKSTSTAGAK